MLYDPDLVALQEVRTKVENAYAASLNYRSFTQEQIDTVVERMAAVAREHSQRLADLAVEETGYGNSRDKLAKNLLAADLLPKSMRGLKTVGILRECREKKIVEIGVPMGVIAAIVPTTNPTSTAIYKILISLKAGNAVVVSPHPRAKRCTCATVDLLDRAARDAGAPEGIIQCILNATLEGTNELMRHKRTAAILSTGGSGIVRAAYSSGKPAFGVGPGNVPVVIDVSASDIRDAVSKLISGKVFDYGTLCSSEQTLIAERGLREAIRTSLAAERAFLCDDRQSAALAKVLLIAPKWSVNPDLVGQAPRRIAAAAGFEVPADTSVLVCEIGGVGPEHPLSAEKLCPVLSVLFVNDWPEVLNRAEAVLRFNGLGHTCGIYAKDDARVREYALRMPAMRVLCNTPTSQGSVGITTNLQPAMTLGCGAIAGNITGDNIGPEHLVNVKRLAYAVRKPEEAYDMPALPSQPSPRMTATATSWDVSAAVQRFLAQRGLPQSEPADSGGTAQLVDRFLHARRMPPPRDVIAASAGPVPVPDQAQTSPPPPATEMQIVDFVCEQDVREAVRKSQKIYIGPKTIVTPSARDLAGQHGTLIVAERK